MMERLLGIVTFRPAAYREVAQDRDATRTALLIVLVVGLVRGLVGALMRAQSGSTALLPEGYGIPEGYMLELPAGTDSTLVLVGRVVVGMVFELIFWSASSRMLTLAARRFFGAQTTRANVLRIVGHTYLFQLLSAIPVPIVGQLLGSILQITGNVIGIREDGKLSTGKAVASVLLSILLTILLIVLISVIISVIITVIVIAVISSGSR